MCLFIKRLLYFVCFGAVHSKLDMVNACERESLGCRGPCGIGPIHTETSNNASMLVNLSFATSSFTNDLQKTYEHIHWDSDLPTWKWKLPLFVKESVHLNHPVWVSCLEILR